MSCSVFAQENCRAGSSLDGSIRTRPHTLASFNSTRLSPVPLANHLNRHPARLPQCPPTIKVPSPHVSRLWRAASSSGGSDPQLNPCFSKLAPAFSRFRRVVCLHCTARHCSAGQVRLQTPSRRPSPVITINYTSFVPTGCLPCFSSGEVSLSAFLARCSLPPWGGRWPRKGNCGAAAAAETKGANSARGLLAQPATSNLRAASCELQASFLSKPFFFLFSPLHRAHCQQPLWPGGPALPVTHFSPVAPSTLRLFDHSLPLLPTCVGCVSQFLRPHGLRLRMADFLNGFGAKRRQHDAHMEELQRGGRIIGSPMSPTPEPNAPSNSRGPPSDASPPRSPKKKRKKKHHRKHLDSDPADPADPTDPADPDNPRSREHKKKHGAKKKSRSNKANGVQSPDAEQVRGSPPSAQQPITNGVAEHPPTLDTEAAAQESVAASSMNSLDQANPGQLKTEPPVEASPSPDIDVPDNELPFRIADNSIVDGYHSRQKSPFIHKREMSIADNRSDPEPESDDEAPLPDLQPSQIKPEPPPSSESESDLASPSAARLARLSRSRSRSVSHPPPFSKPTDHSVSLDFRPNAGLIFSTDVFCSRSRATEPHRLLLVVRQLAPTGASQLGPKTLAQIREPQPVRPQRTTSRWIVTPWMWMVDPSAMGMSALKRSNPDGRSPPESPRITSTSRKSLRIPTMPIKVPAADTRVRTPHRTLLWARFRTGSRSLLEGERMRM